MLFALYHPQILSLSNKKCLCNKYVCVWWVFCLPSLGQTLTGVTLFTFCPIIQEYSFSQKILWNTEYESYFLTFFCFFLCHIIDFLAVLPVLLSLYLFININVSVWLFVFLSVRLFLYLSNTLLLTTVCPCWDIMGLWVVRMTQ